MNLGISFERDHEFSKLLVRRADVDLTTAALELARDACPEIDFAAVHAWIDDRARELVTPLATAPSEEDAILELGRCLAGRHGVRGRTESWDQPESSFLNRVIEKRSGIPISLSVLYMAVAERAGWSLRGVSAPRHFLTRYEGQDGPLFVDAYAGGAILSLDDCLDRAEAATGLPREALLPMHEPASARAIVIRMLNNLKTLYARNEDWPQAWTVQARLLALQPSTYDERRDFALVSVKAGRYGLAIDHLETCLRDAPQDEAALLEQELTIARRGTASWN
jgi:regulator of sirC expression with transglutaminase-like and TPR domain